MPIVMATGQAAGVCAALAAQRGLMPRAVSVDRVQEELIRQGANLRGIARHIEPASDPDGWDA
jgi:hypothetical protein